MIAAAPNSSRRSTFSRKKSHAIPIVANPSRLRSSDPDDAEVRESPSIRKSGPSTPPNKITRPSQGTSALWRGASTFGRPIRRRIKLNAASPRPAPTYRIPANSQGSTDPKSSLESGADAPNKIAEPRARGTPGQRCWCLPVMSKELSQGTKQQLSHSNQSTTAGRPANGLLPSLMMAKRSGHLGLRVDGAELASRDERGDSQPVLRSGLTAFKGCMLLMRLAGRMVFSTRLYCSRCGHWPEVKFDAQSV